MVKERQQWKDGTYKEADIDIGTDTEKIFKRYFQICSIVIRSRYKTVKKSKSGSKQRVCVWNQRLFNMIFCVCCDLCVFHLVFVVFDGNEEFFTTSTHTKIISSVSQEI